MAAGGSSNPDLNGASGLENNPQAPGNSLTVFQPPKHRVPTRLSEMIDTETETILTETTKALDTVSTSEDHFSFLDYGPICTPILSGRKHSKSMTNVTSDIACVLDLTKVPSQAISHPECEVFQTQLTAAKNGDGTIKPFDPESFYTPPATRDPSRTNLKEIPGNFSRDFSSGFGSLSDASGAQAPPPQQLILPPFLCPDGRRSPDKDTASREETLRIEKAFIECNPDFPINDSPHMEESRGDSGGGNISPTPLPQRMKGWARRSPRSSPTLKQLKLTNLFSKTDPQAPTSGRANLRQGLRRENKGIMGNENDPATLGSGISEPPTQLGCSLPTPGQPLQTNLTPTESTLDLSSSIAPIEIIETAGGKESPGPGIDLVDITSTYNSPSPLLPPTSHPNSINSGDLTILDNLANGETDWTTYNETNKWGDTPSSSRSTSPSWPQWWNQRVELSPSPPATDRGPLPRVTWDDHHPSNRIAQFPVSSRSRNITGIDTDSVTISFSQLGIGEENGSQRMEGTSENASLSMALNDASQEPSEVNTGTESDIELPFLAEAMWKMARSGSRAGTKALTYARHHNPVGDGQRTNPTLYSGRQKPNAQDLDSLETGS